MPCVHFSTPNDMLYTSGVFRCRPSLTGRRNLEAFLHNLWHLRCRNINMKMDDDALKQVPKFKYLGLQKMGKNKEDIIQRIKETKCMFNNKKQLLCSI